MGIGEGEGTTINIALPSGSGPSAALLTWESVFAPAIKKFEPEMIFVSAGYDAHWRDPQASMQFQSSDFYALGKKVKSLAEELSTCKGRCLFVLEG